MTVHRKTGKKDTQLENQDRGRVAVTHLRRLIEMAQDPNFRGTIGVSISAKDGALGSVRVDTTSYTDQA